MNRNGEKVVFCGTAAVGKTTIFNRILNREVEGERQATTGAAFASTNVTVAGKEIQLNLWDTAGQEEYRSLVNIYLRGTSIALIVFDLTVHETFDNLVDWYDELIENCGFNNPTVIFVGNKSDLKEERVVSQAEIHNFVSSLNGDYFEVSGLIGTNVDNLYRRICELALHRIEMESEQKKQESKEKQKQNQNQAVVELENTVNKGYVTEEMRKDGCC